MFVTARYQIAVPVTASKRKRASTDFSVETIHKEINDANEVLHRINNFVAGLEIRKVRESLTMFKGKASQACLHLCLVSVQSCIVTAKCL